MHPTITAAVVFACAAAPVPDGSHNRLTPEEVRAGWISLFDGESTFGWTCKGDVVVRNGDLVIGGTQPTEVEFGSAFGGCELTFSFTTTAGESLPRIRVYGPASGVNWDVGASNSPNRTSTKRLRIQAGTVVELDGDGKPHGDPTRIGTGPARLAIYAGKSAISFSQVKLKPIGMTPLFNGKDLTGWSVFTGDPKRAKSKFTVTPEGWLNVKDGPGDLQTTGKYADFVFQGECVSNGKHLNSGIFFRCLPNQYQNGYEMQVRNQWEGDDRTKPVDFGTGAIYRRKAARKVVSTDGEWFAMTLVAHANHFATWVNGYQVVDWTDTRPEHENPRMGLRRAAGHLSIQGHDPTTDLSFRNLRIAEMKKE